MIILKDISEILNEDEKKLLQYKCDNFKVFDIPTFNKNKSYNNYYVRNMVDGIDEVKDLSLTGVFEKIDKLVLEYFTDITPKRIGAWINKINNTTNKNDKYHTDESLFTFIFYLNDDFEGGEFEYIEMDGSTEKITKIKPTKYLSIFSNNELQHRVLPVSKGDRYSLVIFYDTIIKKSKSLI